MNVDGLLSILREERVTNLSKLSASHVVVLATLYHGRRVSEISTLSEVASRIVLVWNTVHGVWDEARILHICSGSGLRYLWDLWCLTHSFHGIHRWRRLASSCCVSLVILRCLHTTLRCLWGRYSMRCRRCLRSAWYLVLLHLPLMLLAYLLTLRERLRDDCESTLSASNQQKSSILGHNKCEHWLNDVVGRDVDPFQRCHEWKLPNHNIASLRSID